MGSGKRGNLPTPPTSKHQSSSKRKRLQIQAKIRKAVTKIEAKRSKLKSIVEQNSDPFTDGPTLEPVKTAVDETRLEPPADKSQTQNQSWAVDPKKNIEGINQHDLEDIESDSDFSVHEQATDQVLDAIGNADEIADEIVADNETGQPRSPVPPAGRTPAADVKAYFLNAMRSSQIRPTNIMSSRGSATGAPWKELTGRQKNVDGGAVEKRPMKRGTPSKSCLRQGRQQRTAEFAYKFGEVSATSDDEQPVQKTKENAPRKVQQAQTRDQQPSTTDDEASQEEDIEASEWEEPETEEEEESEEQENSEWEEEEEENEDFNSDHDDMDTTPILPTNTAAAGLPFRTGNTASARKSPTTQFIGGKRDVEIRKLGPRISKRNHAWQTKIEARDPRPYQWRNSRFFRLAPRKFAICVDPLQGYDLPPGCTKLSPPPLHYTRPEINRHVGYITNAIPTKLAKRGKNKIGEFVDKAGNPANIKPSAHANGYMTVDSVSQHPVSEDHIIYNPELLDPGAFQDLRLEMLTEFNKLDVAEYRRNRKAFNKWRKKRRWQEYRIGRRAWREGFVHLFNPDVTVTEADIRAWSNWIIEENARDDEGNHFGTEYRGDPKPVFDFQNIGQEGFQKLRELNLVKRASDVDEDVYRRIEREVKRRWADEQALWRAQKKRGPAPHEFPGGDEEAKATWDLQRQADLDLAVDKLFTAKILRGLRNKPGRQAKKPHFSDDTNSSSDTDSPRPRRLPPSRRGKANDRKKMATLPSDSESEDEMLRTNKAAKRRVTRQPHDNEFHLLSETDAEALVKSAKKKIKTRPAVKTSTEQVSRGPVNPKDRKTNTLETTPAEQQISDQSSVPRSEHVAVTLTRALFAGLYPHGYQRIPTSNEGFKCGTRAICHTISAMNEQMGLTIPQPDDVMLEALIAARQEFREEFVLPRKLNKLRQGFLSREDRDLNSENNWTVDMLAGALADYGNANNVVLHLGVIFQSETEPFIIHTNEQPGRPVYTIFISNDDAIARFGANKLKFLNHFEGIRRPPNQPNPAEQSLLVKTSHQGDIANKVGASGIDRKIRVANTGAAEEKRMEITQGERSRTKSSPQTQSKNPTKAKVLAMPQIDQSITVHQDGPMMHVPSKAVKKKTERSFIYVNSEGLEWTVKAQAGPALRSWVLTEAYLGRPMAAVDEGNDVWRTVPLTQVYVLLALYGSKDSMQVTVEDHDGCMERGRIFDALGARHKAYGYRILEGACVDINLYPPTPTSLDQFRLEGEGLRIAPFTGKQPRMYRTEDLADPTTFGEVTGREPIALFMQDKDVPGSWCFVYVNADLDDSGRYLNSQIFAEWHKARWVDYPSGEPSDHQGEPLTGLLWLCSIQQVLVKQDAIVISDDSDISLISDQQADINKVVDADSNGRSRGPDRSKDQAESLNNSTGPSRAAAKRTLDAAQPSREQIEGVPAEIVSALSTPDYMKLMEQPPAKREFCIRFNSNHLHFDPARLTSEKNFESVGQALVRLKIMCEMDGRKGWTMPLVQVDVNQAGEYRLSQVRDLVNMKRWRRLDGTLWEKFIDATHGSAWKHYHWADEPHQSESSPSITPKVAATVSDQAERTKSALTPIKSDPTSTTKRKSTGDAAERETLGSKRRKSSGAKAVIFEGFADGPAEIRPMLKTPISRDQRSVSKEADRTPLSQISAFNSEASTVQLALDGIAQQPGTPTPSRRSEIAQQLADSPEVPQEDDRTTASSKYKAALEFAKQAASSRRGRTPRK